MKTIDEYIKTDDKAICENIDDLEYKTRDKVAQNMLSYFRNLVEHIVLSVKLDAPAPCRLVASDLDFACRASADCLPQHLQVI